MWTCQHVVNSGFRAMKIDDQKSINKVWNIKKQVLLVGLRKGNEAGWGDLKGLYSFLC